MLGLILISSRVQAQSVDVQTRSGKIEALYAIQDRYPGLLRGFAGQFEAKAMELLSDAAHLAVVQRDAIGGQMEFGEEPELFFDLRERWSMREVSPLTSMFREGLVPQERNSFLGLYGILKPVKTFFLYRGGDQSSSALGFLTLVEIPVDGEVVPYILSVEGKSLSVNDKKLYVRLAVSRYSVGKMLVKRDEAAETGRPVAVTMPEGWAALNGYQVSALRGTKDAKSPYMKGDLEKANLVDLSDETLPNVRLESTRGVYHVVSFGDLDAFHRAELILDIGATNPKDEKELIAAAQVNQMMVRAAARVVGGARADPLRLSPPELMKRGSKAFLLDLQDFIKIKSFFGISATQVLRMWPLNNAITQLEALNARDLGNLFGTLEAHNLMREFRQKLEGNEGTVEEQLLRRYYWLGLPQNGRMLSALNGTTCEGEISGAHVLTQ